MIHVMHVLHSFGMAGMETGVVKIINGLSGARFKFSACCLEETGVLSGNIRAEKFKIYDMKKPPGIQFGLPYKMSRIFKEERVDVVHTHNFAPYLYGSLGGLIAGTRAIVQGEHGDLLQHLDNPYYIHSRRFLSKFTSKFHTTSNDLKMNLSRLAHIKENKIVTILNGLDVNKYRKQDSSNIRSGLGIGKNSLIIGTVARLAPVKNLAFLIESVARLSRKIDNLSLLIAGDGPQKEMLEKLALELGVNKFVRFLGNRADIPEIMSTFDIFVLTSTSEGLSNSIMEAMACQVPVVASDVGGNPELVIHGETGYLFKINDVENFVDKVQLLACDKDLRNKIGEKGREHVEKHFSLDRMLSDYEELYNAVYTLH